VYISQKNFLRIPFTLSHYQGQAEQSALLNSRATENFINNQAATRLQLGLKKLPFPKPVYIVDRSMNKNGQIIHYCDLFVKQGQKKLRQ